MSFSYHLLSILFVTFMLSAPAAAQSTLSLVLLDAETQEPVEDAFVFFSGSSAGGITDAKGEVEIEVEAYLELVVSHLNYQTKVLSAEQVQALTSSVILLAPSAIKIAEVTVSSSAKDAKKRNRRLKTFTRSFLGPKRDRRGVRITNPEVLLFEEGADGLRAIARDRIKINNEALGYELSFLLDTFLVNSQEEVFYGGRAFFQDLAKTQPARAAAWQTARRKQFEDSKANFFRQLVLGIVDERRFDIGRSVFDKDLQFMGFTPSSPASLKWRRGLLADTLYYSGYLTVVDQSVVTKWTNQSAAGGVVADEYATSFLQSQSGKFVISPDGVLLNNKEIEELGYWADQRVARLLPTNYSVGSGGSNRAPLIDRYLDSLAAFQQAYPQEKVYLHLDKPYYSTGSNIWFKAYLVDAAGHRQQTKSKIVHVELINPAGEISQAITLNRAQGLQGDFKLDSTHRAGVYHLRAYTDYMRNHPREYLFSTSVPVYNPRRIGEGKLTGITLKSQDLPKRNNDQQPFYLGVYPESGVLLGGVENTIVLQLRDTLGAPIEASGKLIDLAEEPVEDWSVNHSGRGVLKFTPEPGKPYWVQVVLDGVSYRVRIPEVQDQALGIHVNNLRDEDVYVKVLSPPGFLADGAYLIGHVRGNVFCSMETVVTNEDMAFPRSQIPAGIVCFSLFNREGELQAERIFFNGFNEDKPALAVEVPYAFFRPRQRVSLSVSWADSLFEEGASLSVSVSDKRLIKRSQSAADIENYLLLSSDLTNPVDLPEAGVIAAGQRGRYLLDLQLIAAYWERFRLEELVVSRGRTLAFRPQTAAVIRGYVTTKGKPEERQMAEVMLTALHPQPTIMKVLTNASGEFEFPGLPYLDTVSYLLQAARFDAKRFDPDIPMLTSKNRKVDIYTKDREPARLPENPPALTEQLPEEFVDVIADVSARSLSLDSLYGPGWQIDLAEVTVSGKKAFDSRNLNVYDLNKLDWIEPRQPVYNILSTLKPGYRFLRDVTRNQLTAEVNNGQGAIVRRPVTITIDGSTSSFGKFMGLTADLIDYIVITRTSITIRTRDQPRSSSTLEQPGIRTVQTNGYYPGANFPAPDYAVSTPGAERPDLRTTIHWEPNFRVEAGKPSVLSFYAADTATEYEVNIQGVTDDGTPIMKTIIVRIAE